jgi:hypothetical protein
VSEIGLPPDIGFKSPVIMLCTYIDLKILPLQVYPIFFKKIDSWIIQSSESLDGSIFQSVGIPQIMVRFLSSENVSPFSREGFLE